MNSFLSFIWETSIFPCTFNANVIKRTIYGIMDVLFYILHSSISVIFSHFNTRMIIHSSMIDNQDVYISLNIA